MILDGGEDLRQYLGYILRVSINHLLECQSIYTFMRVFVCEVLMRVPINRAGTLRNSRDFGAPPTVMDGPVIIGGKKTCQIRKVV